MLVAVLQDEIAPGVQDVLRKDLVRKRLQPLKGIRRIGENDIELFPADRQEIEDVVPDHRHVGEAEARSFSLDEGRVAPLHLDAIHPRSAAGSEFEGYGPSAAEKIQHLEVLELILVVEDIEESLLGEVGGRPGFVAHRRIDDLALQASAYYPHITSTVLK